MTTVATYTIASVFIVSFISLAGLFTLSLNQNILRKIIFVLVSLATGALLGDAFIHLIPEAFGENESATLVSILVIVGLLVFFVLEKFLHWHHSHGEEERCENERTEISDGDKNKKIHPLGRLILVSDGLHNFIDGTIIGVSYLASIEIGVATTIAVILHEIPQEFGDFGILIHSGFSRTRALFLNFLSASLAIAGALVALLIGTRAESFIPFVLPFAAGTFIYIATADLIPELHKTKNIAHSLIQILAIIVGVLAMLLLLLVEV